MSQAGKDLCLRRSAGRQRADGRWVLRPRCGDEAYIYSSLDRVRWDGVLHICQSVARMMIRKREGRSIRARMYLFVCDCNVAQQGSGQQRVLGGGKGSTFVCS